MDYKHKCENCKCEFTTRKKTSKYCSRSCVWENKGWSSELNTTCTNCGTKFHLKPFAKNRYKRTHGWFCTNTCVAEFKSKGVYDGDKNPNYRGRTVDSDGYPLRDYVPHENRVNGLKRMKLHQAVCCEALGVLKIGKGFHVHHRDCDLLNNTPTNLAVLGISDHKWLHKQYGSATLWAFYHKKVSFNDLLSWCNNKERAERLLNINVVNQTIESLGILIDGELTLKDKK